MVVLFGRFIPEHHFHMLRASSGAPTADFAAQPWSNTTNKGKQLAVRYLIILRISVASKIAA